MSPIVLPATGYPGEEVPVQVWESKFNATDQGTDVSRWLTEYLSQDRLVRMPDDGVRKTKKETEN